MRQTEYMPVAWEIHRANGHPRGYEGPCWGPTQDEVTQAKSEVTEHLRHMTDGYWHDDCRWCLRRRRHGGTGLET